MVDPIGASFQSLTYGYEQQQSYDPHSPADYNFRVADTSDGGKTYHMVHIPNDSYGAMFQYIVTVTDANTNSVQIVESFSSGSNTYNGTIISHNGGAFVVSAAPAGGGSSFEWLFSNVATDDGYFTVYPNGASQAGTFSPTCYAAGARILTPRGEVAVEDLRAGDEVVTHDGSVQPVIWIGHRTTDPARWPNPDDATPVRVLAHAFGENQPHRDLRLSPGHAIFWEGALIPVGKLINDVTIVREAPEPVTYYHVELARHGVIIAEGLPAETYLDVGNRAAFANGGALAAFRPQFDPVASCDRECAPRIHAGALVDSTRRALIARAGQLGHRMTDDAAIQLILDGEALQPVREEPGFVTFALPAGPRCDVIVQSRAAAPAWTLGTDDVRVLGIAIEAIELRGSGMAMSVAPEAAILSAGFHAPDLAGDATWRWTDGRATLPASLFAPFGQGCEISFRLSCRMSYWLPAPTGVEARVAA